MCWPENGQTALAMLVSLPNSGMQYKEACVYGLGFFFGRRGPFWEYLTPKPKTCPFTFSSVFSSVLYI